MTYYRKKGGNSTPWNAWSEIEIETVKNGLIDSKTFADLTKSLTNRTENAIRWRAMTIVNEEIKSSGKSTEKVLDKYHIEIDDYKKWLVSAEESRLKKEESKENKVTVSSLSKRIDELEERIQKLESKKKSSKK